MENGIVTTRCMRFSRLGSEMILKWFHRSPRRSLHLVFAIFVPSPENTRALALPAGAQATQPARHRGTTSRLVRWSPRELGFVGSSGSRSGGVGRRADHR